MSTLPILYGLSRSVYTRIARLALEEKGTTYRLEEVEIFGPTGVPKDQLNRHPFGRIPVLQHGDFSVYETNAICRYIDEAFVGPSLQPVSAMGRARMAQVIGVLDSYAYRPMVWGVFVQRVRVPLRGGTSNEEEISTALAAVRVALGALSSLKGEEKFFAGETLTLADLHSYPMLKYLSLAPEGQAAIDAHSSLRRWLSAMDERPSVVGTRSEYE